MRTLDNASMLGVDRPVPKPHRRRPEKSFGIAAEWLYDYFWKDSKCSASCEGELVTEGLSHDEEVTQMMADGYPDISTHTVYEWHDPQLTEIVLKWRVRDAFGFVTWETYPEDVRAAFEAFMLANEVRAAYVYAASVVGERG